jgi:hypothetical protein
MGGDYWTVSAKGVGEPGLLCRRRLGARTFEKWERRFRRQEGKRGKFVEVPVPVSSNGPWAVEVEFPNGVRLRVRG